MWGECVSNLLAVPSARRIRVRRGVLLGVALSPLVTVGVAVAADCDYREISYCNKLIQPGSFCREGADRHTYVRNAAHYDGAGSVNVCQRIVGAVSGAQYSYNCAIRHTYSGSIAGQNCDTVLYVYVQNASSNRHTIRGAATY